MLCARVRLREKVPIQETKREEQTLGSGDIEFHQARAFKNLPSPSTRGHCPILQKRRPKQPETTQWENIEMGKSY